jgi:ParB-like chromosome segregation protein Spo0J
MTKQQQRPPESQADAWRAKYPIHEAAELFPLLEGQAFADLVDNIKRYGLRDPIVLTSDGKLLDGRNRLRACLAADVEPKTKTWRGPGKAFQYVISVNLHRRHLDTSQRAIIAAKIATLESGARTDLASNEARLSQPEAAEALNVSRASVQRAKAVLDKGTPELVTAVRDGDLSVGAATAAMELPPAEQREVVRKVKQGVKPVEAVPKKSVKEMDDPALAATIVAQFGDGQWHWESTIVEKTGGDAKAVANVLSQMRNASATGTLCERRTGGKDGWRHRIVVGVGRLIDVSLVITELSPFIKDLEAEGRKPQLLLSSGVPATMAVTLKDILEKLTQSPRSIPSVSVAGPSTVQTLLQNIGIEICRAVDRWPKDGSLDPLIQFLDRQMGNMRTLAREMAAERGGRS